MTELNYAAAVRRVDGKYVLVSVATHPLSHARLVAFELLDIDDLYDAVPREYRQSVAMRNFSRVHTDHDRNFLTYVFDKLPESARTLFDTIVEVSRLAFVTIDNDGVHGHVFTFGDALRYETITIPAICA